LVLLWTLVAELSSVSTVRWAALIKPSNALRACSTLFSAKSRISGGTS
jgi:hypothetical protein